MISSWAPFVAKTRVLKNFEKGIGKISTILKAERPKRSTMLFLGATKACK